jgi:phospholipid/cholesterol/gamma-HCH transport system substrate-binding protein
MPSARQISWAKFRVLVVAVIAMAILSVLVYLLTGGTLLEEKSALLLYVPDATGLGVGSLVRVNGVDVGKVKSISLSGSNQPNRVVRLELSVEREYMVAIPSDAFAQIDSDTAVGDKFVDIDTTQSKSTTPIQANSELTFKPQQDLLKTLDIPQFTQQLRSVEALLDDLEQGRNAAGQLLLSDALYENIAHTLGDFEREIRAVTSKTNPVGRMLYTDQFYRQIREPLLRLDQRLADIQAGQGQLGKLLNSSADYVQLRNELVNFRRPIENLRGSPFMASDEQFNAWSRGLASLIKGVAEFNTNQVMSNSEMYDNLTGFATELRDSVKEFRQDPRKFLRLGPF